MTILRDWSAADIETMREMRAGGAIWRAIGLRFNVTHKVIIRLSQRYGFYDGEATHAAPQPKPKKGMRSNRAWSDEVEAEIERLVTGTLLCPRDIAIKTSAKFSLSITGRQIENWARRKGLIRDKLLARPGSSLAPLGVRTAGGQCCAACGAWDASGAGVFDDWGTGMIHTTTEAQSMADLSRDWKIVAYRVRHGDADMWDYTIGDERVMRAMRDDAKVTTVQGRQDGRTVLYARRAG